MIQFNILVEGQSEEVFVKELMFPFLYKHNIIIKPVIISTKRIKEGGKFKGGLTNSNFENFISDLKRLINSTPQGYVSTFIDYYRIPSKFPGYDERVNQSSSLAKVLFLEQKLFDYLNQPRNFIPFIQLHEFESFHFADKAGFQKYLLPSEARIEELCKIVDIFSNPEDINEGTETSPSKRILANYPQYEKVNEGNLLLMEIGIEKLIEKCPHFKSYIENIIALNKI